MSNANNLTECIYALTDIAKTVESLAISNEQRSSYVQEVATNARTMAEEILKIRDVVNKTKDISKNLQMLALNTAIEAAREQVPTVTVISNEMKLMSESYQELGNEVVQLSQVLQKQVQWLVTSLDASVASVTNTSASLEEISASTEQLLAAMEQVEEGANNGV